MKVADRSAPIELGDWIVDQERHAVLSPEGEPADLSESEFRTLVCLARNRGKAMTRDELYAFVVGPGERDPLDRRIDVYVSNLRKKLKLDGPAKIRTVHRVGYIID
jgi:DNA-binding response OmpR family regulator